MTLEEKYDSLLDKLAPLVTVDHLPRNFKGVALPLTWYKPYFTGKPDEGLFVQGDGLYYTERGEARLLVKGSDEELLYVIFEGLTAELAGRYEVVHRNPKTEDTRRDWFPIQETLMGVLSEEWRLKLKRKHDQLLCDV